MSQNRINLLGADGLAFPAPNKKSFLPRSCCRDTQNREVNTFCWLPLVPTCLELKLFASHLEPILAEECCICKLKQCARTGQVAFIYYYLSLSHAAIPMRANRGRSVPHRSSKSSKIQVVSLEPLHMMFAISSTTATFLLQRFRVNCTYTHSTRTRYHRCLD